MQLKVFLAHSFDENPPQGEQISDLAVVDWFLKLMKRRPLSFQVLTGSRPAPGPIDEKVTADIADCGCVIGIFTKRHFDKYREKWLPSQFVLCECASAIGFYYNTNKLICGFYEEDINPKDLALITIGGLELVPFKRANLEKDKARFVEYLRKLPDIVATGSYKEGQAFLFKPPYVQQRLYKIYHVYRSGRFTCQNINTMLITDIDRFIKEFDSCISHEIWHYKTRIPQLGGMIETPINKRGDKPFLNAILRSLNQKKMNIPLQIIPKRQEGNRAFFDMAFSEKEGNALRLKNQDVIRYQYAWGLPSAYPTSDSELEIPVGGREINEGAYCVAEVFASHGLVQDLVFELRFERGKGSFFSKSPFSQSTSSFGDSPVWSLPRDLPLIEEDDHEMWFQTYRLIEHNFTGKVRVMWRPSGGIEDTEQKAPADAAGQRR